MCFLHEKRLNENSVVRGKKSVSNAEQKTMQRVAAALLYDLARIVYLPCEQCLRHCVCCVDVHV